ncbi:hypothetical protein PRIC1_000381 [Phytophthora ramorum]
MLQEWAQEIYMKEFKRLGTRQTPDAVDAADPELLTLAVQMNPHAYRLVRDQYKFATGADAQYEVEIDEPQAKLRNQDHGEHDLHVVNMKVRIQYIPVQLCVHAHVAVAV